jgi:hypothetical protein
MIYKIPFTKLFFLFNAVDEAKEKDTEKDDNHDTFMEKTFLDPNDYSIKDDIHDKLKR